jgi:mRNA-degrading endonuclease YafQ of YafQ-DinJ toxin-antitoxin module
MAKIVTTNYYENKLTQFMVKHPELREKYVKTIKLLEANPFHTSLRLHKQKGNLSDLHSVSLNMKYSILLDFIIKDDQMVLINIGDDDGLYCVQSKYKFKKKYSVKVITPHMKSRYSLF